MKHTFEGFKKDFKEDMMHNGDGLCSAILGTGMATAVVGAIISNIITYNNPYCWLALNFKDFALKFIIGDAVVCTAGTVATKVASAKMQKNAENEDAEDVESYDDFSGMIKRTSETTEASETNETNNDNEDFADMAAIA